MLGTKIVNAFLKTRNSKFFNTLVISVIIASALYAGVSSYNEIIPAQGEKNLEVKTLEKVTMLDIDFEVLNALVSPNEKAIINLKIRIY